MAKTLTLSLGDHWNQFISAQLDNGRYASSSEVVRDALRLLEEKEANTKLEALRRALIEGEESGEPVRLDMDSIRKQAMQEAGISSDN